LPPFTEWASETRDAIRLKNVATQIFKKAVEKLKLTPQAVMAFFNVRRDVSFIDYNTNNIYSISNGTTNQEGYQRRK
jgi:hypothetical protein